MNISKHQRILNQIATIRSAHSYMSEIFLYGSCLNFFCILKSIYPEAEAYFNVDHVITRIDSRCYDITGAVNAKGYKPITDFYNKRRTSRAFTQMFNSELPLVHQVLVEAPREANMDESDDDNEIINNAMAAVQPQYPSLTLEELRQIFDETYERLSSEQVNR